MTSIGLEELELLLEAEVGRVARGVGERAGIGDRADERLHATVVAAELEDLLDDGAVLGLELADARVGAHVVRVILDLDEETSLGVGLGGACDAPEEAFEGHGDSAAGQLHAVGDARDRADGRVLPVVLRHEQDTILVADVDGQRHVHVREDDDVFEWDEQQLAHDQPHAPRTLSVVSTEKIATRARCASGLTKRGPRS